MNIAFLTSASCRAYGLPATVYIRSVRVHLTMILVRAQCINN